MKIIKIKFKERLTNSLGRNGYMKTSGVHLSDIGMIPTVEISPINGKGYKGRGSVCIPTEDIPELIEALKEIVGES